MNNRKKITGITFAFQEGLKDTAGAIRNQEFFVQLLYRYLCSTVGKPNAVQLLPKYMYLIAQLEEMAQIMITKRLTL